MEELLTVAKALSDPNRLRALMALQTGELCLCQLIELLGLAPSTVSRHMSLLRRAGLVESRKEGRWHYYRLAGRRAPRLARRALAWAREAAADSPQVRQDARRLRRILQTPREEFCRRYRPGRRTSACARPARG
jgi:DNA-binding transcriptional ArsR family regulator